MSLPRFPYESECVKVIGQVRTPTTGRSRAFRPAVVHKCIGTVGVQARAVHDYSDVCLRSLPTLSGGLFTYPRSSPHDHGFKRGLSQLCEGSRSCMKRDELTPVRRMATGLSRAIPLRWRA